MTRSIDVGLPHPRVSAPTVRGAELGRATRYTLARPIDQPRSWRRLSDREIGVGVPDQVASHGVLPELFSDGCAVWNLRKAGFEAGP